MTTDHTPTAPITSGEALKLRDCPMCDAEPIEDGKDEYLRIRCEQCGLQGPAFDFNPDREDEIREAQAAAARHWNRRATEQVQVPSGEIDAAARAMAIHVGWLGWDNATDCMHTPAGNDPDDEREYWRDLARIALAQRAGAADKPVARVVLGGVEWLEGAGMVPYGAELYAAPVAATADAAPACHYPLCQSEAEQQRIAAEVHAQLYTGDAAPAGAAAVRNAALEEAAELAHSLRREAAEGDEIAERILALKSAAAEVTPAANKTT